jgi:cytochrome P450
MASEVDAHQTWERASASELGSFMIAADVARDPYPYYGRLRREATVAHAPELDTRFITRFEDIRGALRDPETFRCSSTGTAGLVLGPNRADAVDGPQHERYRNGVKPPLAPRAVELRGQQQLDPLVETRLQLIAGRGTADLVEEYFEPLSVDAFNALFGIDGLEPETLRRWLHGLSAGVANVVQDPHVQADSLAISREIEERLRPHLERLDARPDGGLVSHLLDRASGDTFEERVADVTPTIKLLIGAGLQEPGDGAGVATAGILQDPQTRERFARAPAAHVNAAVEEGLRWIAPVQQIRRETTRDVEVAGMMIPAGCSVTLVVASANRDESVWGDDADLFVLERPPQPHFGFGYGTHFCAGNYFGRVLMRLAVGRLFERFPDIELDPGSAPVFDGAVFRKALHIPARWSRRS